MQKLRQGCQRTEHIDSRSWNYAPEKSSVVPKVFSALEWPGEFKTEVTPHTLPPLNQHAGVGMAPLRDSKVLPSFGTNYSTSSG